MGLDVGFGTAFAKSQAAAFGSLPTSGTVFVSVANRDKRSIIFPVKRLADLGFPILATAGTASMLRRNGVEVESVRKFSQGPGPAGEPTIVQLIMDGRIDLIFNTPAGLSPDGRPRFDGYEIRTAAVLRNIACITTVQGLAAAVQGIEAVRAGHIGVRSLQSWARGARTLAARSRPRRSAGARGGRPLNVLAPAARARGYARVLRPVLFRAYAGDPERVHHATLRALAALERRPAALAALRLLTRGPRRPVEAFGLTFPGVVGLAAGMDKDGVAPHAWAALGFGHVELGTVTATAQPGNPRPRLFRLPASGGLVNRMGFNNAGAAALAARLEAAGRPSGGTGAGHPGRGLARQDQDDAAGRRGAGLPDARSPRSPRTPTTWRSTSPARTPPACAPCRTPARSATSSPRSSPRPASRTRRGRSRCWSRSPPTCPSTRSRTCWASAPRRAPPAWSPPTRRWAATGIAEPDRWRAGEAGGLSGAPLTVRAREVVAFLAARTALPVIGVGGIMTAADGQALLDAGARLLQVYTGFVYRGPALLREIEGVRRVRESYGVRLARRRRRARPALRRHRPAPRGAARLGPRRRRRRPGTVRPRHGRGPRRDGRGAQAAVGLLRGVRVGRGRRPRADARRRRRRRRAVAARRQARRHRLDHGRVRGGLPHRRLAARRRRGHAVALPRLRLAGRRDRRRAGPRARRLRARADQQPRGPAGPARDDGGRDRPSARPSSTRPPGATRARGPATSASSSGRRSGARAPASTTSTARSSRPGSGPRAARRPTWPRSSGPRCRSSCPRRAAR